MQITSFFHRIFAFFSMALARRGLKSGQFSGFHILKTGSVPEIRVFRGVQDHATLEISGPFCGETPLVGLAGAL